eukprot:1062795-Pelagomonas_calceolata.AAC.6
MAFPSPSSSSSNSSCMHVYQAQPWCAYLYVANVINMVLPTAHSQNCASSPGLWCVQASALPSHSYALYCMLALEDQVTYRPDGNRGCVLTSSPADAQNTCRSVWTLMDQATRRWATECVLTSSPAITQNQELGTAATASTPIGIHRSIK